MPSPSWGGAPSARQAKQAKLASQRSLADAILRTYEARQRKEGQLVSADVEVIAEARRRLDVWERETTCDLEAQHARVRMVLHGLQQRGHDFLQQELQLAMLPRLLRRDDFVDRFQRHVLAATADELQTVVGFDAYYAEEARYRTDDADAPAR